MANSNGPVIDMTPDGAFIEPSKPSFGTILARLAAFAIFLCVGALVFWTAIFLLPILLILGIGGYVFARSRFRNQLRR